jgi:3-phosphoshikimate 1-carboxyvinyltransferase
VEGYIFGKLGKYRKGYRHIHFFLEEAQETDHRWKRKRTNGVSQGGKREEDGAGMRIRGPVKGVRGELRVPSDKSISHRALILGAISEGETIVKNWLRSADTEATMEILRQLGTEITVEDEKIVVRGRGYSFEEPEDVLDARNSGTTARIILGILSTQPFFSVITGDSSLRKRPMRRVVEPLRDMGAEIMGRELGDKLPLAVNGRRLRGISWKNIRSSAQVKSAILLAGLRAEGYTEVFEPVMSRDHTERMLRAFGAEVMSMSEERGHLVKIRGDQSLMGTVVHCPADPSSAAFFAGLCVICGGELLLRDLLVNPTRDGFFRKLKEMGAEVEYTNERELTGEPIADVIVRKGGELSGVEVTGEEVPSMVDEIPILAVVMAFARGRSRISGARELRVKESDRLRAVCENLSKMGAKVEELEDGLLIEGGDKLKGTAVKTYGDHRIAMAFAVAGLCAEGETLLDDPDCVSVSYPDFFKDLFSLVEYS